MSELTIGDRTVPVDLAETWIRTYTDAAANRRATEQCYAYPAYDRFEGGCVGSDRLSDADLLAPVLLNVDIPVRGFYDLQRVRSTLEEALHAIGPGLRLEDLTRGRVDELVVPLYRVLDSPTDKPWGIGVTKLSKVLHRKRPALVALHDAQVLSCYKGRLRWPQRDRPWAQYMADLSWEIAEDLRSGAAAWDRLAAAVGDGGPLSRVRLLDIVAWNLGRPGAPAGGASRG